MPLTESQVENHLSELIPPSPWKRSSKGSLWRNWLHLRLVVYFRRGQYRWLIDNRRGGVRYSPVGFASEGEARDSVWDEVKG